MPDSIYQSAARRYMPRRIKVLFLAESPPHVEEHECPRYFYFDELTSRDYLFRHMMEVLLPEEFRACLDTDSKVYALVPFRDRCGYFLADVCEDPIRNMHDRPARESVMQDCLQTLPDRLHSLISTTTPIVLIGRHFLRIAHSDLQRRGFYVYGTEPLPYPGYSGRNIVQFQSELCTALSILNRRHPGLCVCRQ